MKKLKKPDHSDFANPIGEVTTYIVNDFEDISNPSFNLDSFSPENIPKVFKVSIASPIPEQDDSFQLYPIYNWLEKFHLEDCYENLVETGYYDVDVMVRQMNGPMPLSERNLKDMGIRKPGHRRYLLIKLEEEAGLSSKINPKSQNKDNLCLKCCASSNSTRNLTNFPLLSDWLQNISLGSLYNQFIEAGYDSYESLLDIQNSLHPLTNKLLEQEVKIANSDHRLAILKKLQLDSGLLYPDNFKITFDGTRKTGCGSCILS
jgi:SAM domain (Sterile alpha motif)